MIDVHHLGKRYGKTCAVEDLSFTVRPGSVTGFLGPNGAGKSTTLRMVLGLTRPDTGSARIDGRAYRELAPPLRHVGALLETAEPHPSLRAVDHLTWLARSNRIPRRRVHEVLAAMDLAEAARHRVATFSLGMRRRLALAAALLGDPAVLVLDEPANGLDPEGIRRLRDLVRTLAAEGRTVLLSSHLLAETALIADRVVVLHRGRLLADAALPEFLARHTGTPAGDRTTDPDRVGEGTPDPDRGGERTADPYGVGERTPDPHRLEDVFLGLIGADDAERGYRRG